MLKGRNRPHPLPVIPVVLSAVLAFLLSGCLWGVARDADTGAPLSGVTVSYTDANGATGSTSTDAHGIYSFDIAHGPVPAAGAVSFELGAPGYETLTAARLVEYNDNANATIADLSSFWEIQGFDLTEHLVQRVEVDLTSINVNNALLAPPPNPILTIYYVTFKVYDPADLTTPVCDNSSSGTVVTAVDPPPESLDFRCVMPGDAFSMTVTVTLVRQWYEMIGWPVPIPTFMADSYVSTAAHDWMAPAPNTSWQNATINSSDATGPDSPNITFEGQIRFRAILGSAPLMISDRNLKENFASIDRHDILRRLVNIPILTWNYIGEPPSTRHVGPMAQDFYAAFGLGDSDRTISPVDAYGVAFAAIQELHQMVIERDTEIATLKQQIADLAERIAALERRLGSR